MRLQGSIPEAEWLIVRLLAEKVREVRCVVVAADALVGRIGDAITELPAGRTVRAANGAARSPPLAGGPHEIAPLLQNLRLCRVVRRKPAGMGPGVLDLPAVPTGEQRRPRWTASGRRGNRVGEQHPFPGDAIECGRRDAGATIGRGDRKSTRLNSSHV